MARNIHPTALVAPEAELGEGVEVGAYAFASIGDAPQDKKYRGEPTRLEIGDRNVFREFTTVNRGTTHDKGVTRIGSDNLFMAYTHVAHDCIVGDHIVMANVATLGGHVEVGDHVIMGGLSAVHQFCKIGAHAFIANNAAVTRDVPPYIMAVGQPASRTRQCHRPVASGLLAGAGAQHQECPSHALPLRPEARRGRRALREAAANQPELVPFVDFLGRSTRSLVR
jgi:UDP-N-acetylglucosamine acyltransferase